jgi:amino acid transporter
MIALGLNGVIGVGIFFIPATVAAHLPGPIGALSFAATALVCLPVALAFSRLGTRFSQDGGPYVFASHAFGSLSSFAVGWLAYVSSIFSSAAVIRGLAQALVPSARFAHAPVPMVSMVASIIVLALFCLVSTGLRVTATAWSVITVAKIVPLLALVCAPLIFTLPLTSSQTVVHAAPLSMSEFARAAIVVLFSLQGFEVVAVPAGHVKRRWSIPVATLVSLLGAAALYVCIQLVCVRAVPALAQSNSPIADAAFAYGGATFSRLLQLGTSVSAAGICLGMMAMSPRYLSTLGQKDGLGPWVGETSSRGVPQRALLITAAAILLLVQFGSLDELFALSSIAVLSQYAATAVALIVLAKRRFGGLRRGDIVIGVLALLSSLIVVWGASWTELLRAGLVIAAGLLIRAVVVRKAITQQ